MWTTWRGMSIFAIHHRWLSLDIFWQSYSNVLWVFCIFSAFSLCYCHTFTSWSLILEERQISSLKQSLLPSEKNTHVSSERGKTWISPPTLPSLLSLRCLQWERPNALLEERERFIKDWWDSALSVFYWRLPAFLWACLLQQHWYVRLGLSELYPL